MDDSYPNTKSYKWFAQSAHERAVTGSILGKNTIKSLIENALVYGAIINGKLNLKLKFFETKLFSWKS